MVYMEWRADATFFAASFSLSSAQGPFFLHYVKTSDLFVFSFSFSCLKKKTNVFRSRRRISACQDCPGVMCGDSSE